MLLTTYPHNFTSLGNDPSSKNTPSVLARGTKRQEQTPFSGSVSITMRLPLELVMGSGCVRLEAFGSI